MHEVIIIGKPYARKIFEENGGMGRMWIKDEFSEIGRFTYR